MEKAKQIIKDILQKMGIDKAVIDIKKDNSLKDKEVAIIELELLSKDAEIFFEDGAVGLNALQHLLRVLFFRGGSSQGFLLIDINDYRKEREKFLIESAQKAAQKVRRMKKPVILEPMSAYERRFIHLKLAEYPDIVTESIGEEPERKIVVRLYP